MHKPSTAGLALAMILVLSGCATLAPRGSEVTPSIPSQWPASLAAGDSSPTRAVADVADIGWREFFPDPRLQTLITQSLDNNRDLRVAALNVVRARAQYRIQRADRMPSFNVQGQMTRSGGDVPVSEQFSANLGVAEFELDLFGRVRNLSDAALQKYFAETENRRGAQLTLVAEVANAWLTLGADREQLRIAQATLAARSPRTLPSPLTPPPSLTPPRPLTPPPSPGCAGSGPCRGRPGSGSPGRRGPRASTPPASPGRTPAGSAGCVRGTGRCPW
jgi:multidrug efflux system outer membrane protein